MENKKLEHPNWYALLLILCANTSVMAAVGATVFGLIFIYELIKSKKNLTTPIIIMLAGAVLVLCQLMLSLDNNDVVRTVEKSLSLNSFLSVWFIIYFFAFISLFVYYAKMKKFPIFLFCTSFLLVVIFSIYNGRIWHWFFFYIYLIISSWTTIQEDINSKFQSIILGFISFLLIFFIPSKSDMVNVWNCDTKIVSQSILSDNNLKKSVLLVVEPSVSVIKNYLYQKSEISLINYCSGSYVDYNDVTYYKSPICEFGRVHKISFNDELLMPFYTNSTYLLISKNIELPASGKLGAMKDYKFVLYKSVSQLNLYKVEKIN